MYLSKPTNELLDEFGAGKAAPGSGSAAALMGLLAAKLIVTVCDLSASKELSERQNSILKVVRSTADARVAILSELFEADAESFERVIEIRKLRDAETRSAERTVLTRQANVELEVATNCVFDICGEVLILIDQATAAFDEGWHAVRGDAGSALSVAIAALTSGLMIIALNLKTLRSRQYAETRYPDLVRLNEQLRERQSRATDRVIRLDREAVRRIGTNELF